MNEILVLEDDIARIHIFRDLFYQNEDLRNIPVTYVDKAINCIEMLKNKNFSLIFLDHDLGNEIMVDTSYANTGSGVARWISENPDSVKESKVIVHSLNPIGAEYMTDLIPNSTHIPFHILKNMILEFKL